MINTSEILVSKEHIDPLRDQGFVIYKLGRIDPVTAGKREAHMLWGNVKGGSGAAGKSAYEIAVLNGFVGTEIEWLASLVGDDGYTPQKGTDYFDGDDGISSYTYVAYASDAAGTGWSLAPTDLLKYRAEIHSTTSLTPVVGDFAAATWVKYLGDDGTGGGGGGTVTVITEGENIEVYYDFKDAIPFTYTCPMALRFLEVEHEGNAPALSVALNTDMAKYDDLVITPDGPGLVIVRGKVATAFDWPVYIDFDHAGEETYKCPYPLKFLAMEHEQANAPTLSVALNTNMAKYQVLTITTDAPGLVSLIGILL